MICLAVSLICNLSNGTIVHVMVLPSVDSNQSHRITDQIMMKIQTNRYYIYYTVLFKLIVIQYFEHVLLYTFTF